LYDLHAENRLRFERLVLPHVDAAFNLARWLLCSREDAEEVAQEALLRACRFFRGFHGGDARAWLLQIVRNTCYSWLEKNHRFPTVPRCPRSLGLFVSCTSL
jgi:RNA polymerase sigma-70 factor (ECF subfamily)